MQTPRHTHRSNTPRVTDTPDDNDNDNYDDNDNDNNNNNDNDNDNDDDDQYESQLQRGQSGKRAQSTHSHTTQHASEQMVDTGESSAAAACTPSSIHGHSTLTPQAPAQQKHSHYWLNSEIAALLFTHGYCLWSTKEATRGQHAVNAIARRPLHSRSSFANVNKLVADEIAYSSMKMMQHSIGQQCSNTTKDNMARIYAILAHLQNPTGNKNSSDTVKRQLGASYDKEITDNPKMDEGMIGYASNEMVEHFIESDVFDWTYINAHAHGLGTNRSVTSKEEQEEWIRDTFLNRAAIKQIQKEPAPKS